MGALVDSQIKHLSVPKRFIAYAHAYRDAAELACSKLLAEEGSASWASAAVILMLTAHATELFLKGMILARAAEAEIEHHRINDLVQEYDRLYPEESLAWYAPMQTHYVGFATDEIVALRKQTPVPSILTAIRQTSREQSGVESSGLNRTPSHNFCMVSNKTSCALRLQPNPSLGRISTGTALGPQSVAGQFSA
jgi:hypothetical protein